MLTNSFWCTIYQTNQQQSKPGLEKCQLCSIIILIVERHYAQWIFYFIFIRFQLENTQNVPLKYTPCKHRVKWRQRKCTDKWCVQDDAWARRCGRGFVRLSLSQTQPQPAHVLESHKFNKDHNSLLLLAIWLDIVSFKKYTHKCFGWGWTRHLRNSLVQPQPKN